MTVSKPATMNQTHTTKQDGASGQSLAVPKALATPSNFSSADTHAITEALNPLVADLFALYVKTKNFHWHMSGPHFRDYHLLLDEQADQIFAGIDLLAERVRRVGGTTIHSISQIGRLQTIADNNEAYVAPAQMLTELCHDNKSLAKLMRSAHEICDHAYDVASTSILETLIDEAERRTWFLFEAAEKGEPRS